MYTHQLIELLKTFSSKEMMWFSKFLHSPYFNNRKMIIKLFKVLKKHYPEFEDRNFTKEYIYSSIYGKSQYNDSTFRNLMSDLLKLALQFLKMENIEKKEIESSFFLIYELFNRGLVNLSLNQMTGVEKLLDDRNIIDDEYFLSKFKIESDRFSVNLENKKTVKKSFVISESEKYINGIVYFICYFLIESLKRNVNLLNYTDSYNIQKNIDVVSDFLELFNFDKIGTYIRENSEMNVPLVELYFKLVKMYVNKENDNSYFDFKKSFLQHSKQIGLQENYFFFQALISYCVTKKAKGIESGFDIDREIFELQLIQIKNEYYKTDPKSYLGIDVYRNLLLNCITVKELKHMEEYITKYSKKVVPSQIENVENYSYALLFFEKGAFSKALSYLNKVKFEQFALKRDIRNLQLKINYELKYYESAISTIDAYKHFLSNSQLISESIKIQHNNFLSYALKLIHYKTGSKKVNLSFMSHRIEKSKNVFDKGWLLEKIRNENK